ncbi:MAG: hypothetical protein ACK4TL_14980 [Hyphomicrobiaceae bacterium]
MARVATHWGRITTRVLISLLLLALPGSLALAQRTPADDRWELLGEQTVGFRVDTDSIVLRHNEEWYRTRAYRALLFQAERNDVHLISLRIVYLNGHVEDIRVDRLIRRGSGLEVDLPGERSYLRQIDMRYRSDVGISLGPDGIRLQQAVIKVYGDRARRGPPPIAQPRWDEMDVWRFDRTDAEVVLRPGRDSGRVRSIKLRSTGESIEIRRIAIRFANGETQIVRIDRRFEQGDETDAIDLDGRRPRSIERVTVSLEPRRRPGRAALVLLGDREDQDDPYLRRGWSLLGEQTVGFAVDRDVIEVNQSEEWYRNRRFRALHIVAERNDVHLMGLRIVYMNGFGEDLRIDQRIPAGSSAEVDLRGARSFIRRIELTYRSRPGFGGRAVVKVYGEPSRR